MDLKPLPPRPHLEQYRKQARDLLKAAQAAAPEALERFRRYHPHLAPRPTLAGAQLVTAREHGFDSWPKFKKHLEALARADSPVSQFERAAGAIVTGDATTLTRLLRDNPELARARSERLHRATLLHYISANGVEDYRQKSPANAVEIAAILLRAGSEVDAIAQAYGQSTTLGLVASSAPPRDAGVQIALIQTLLEWGAAIDGLPGATPPIISALANGCGQAAEFLAGRGARLHLESAAGVGRLAVVQAFFRPDGSLQPGATQQQMDSGFVWACLYGRTEVVAFLLDRGADPAAHQNTGQTGLHSAVLGAHPETIALLLARRVPLEARNVYGGTVLGQAAWCVLHGDRRVDYLPIVETLLRAGARVENAGYPTGNQRLDDLLRRYLSPPPPLKG